MQKLAQLSAQFEIVLSTEQLNQFAHYQQMLIDWNTRLNLTRIREPDDIVIRHFLDSLSCVSVMGDLAGLRVIDVGTGGGFPGLPLKILYPSMWLTLTDSVAKKTRFLEAVVAELGLEQVEVVAERAETLGQDDAYRQQFDWALARAVARMPVLAEYLLPLVRVGGNMLAQKGATAAVESAESQSAITRLGGGQPTLTEINLPQHDKPHFLVVIKKIADTPAAYPRKIGRPAKRPL